VGATIGGGEDHPAVTNRPSVLGVNERHIVQRGIVGEGVIERNSFAAARSGHRDYED
jgi:hypothetical protein